MRDEVSGVALFERFHGGGERLLGRVLGVGLRLHRDAEARLRGPVEFLGRRLGAGERRGREEEGQAEDEPHGVAPGGRAREGSIIPSMAGNTFGKLFRVTTAGVSHGPGYLCIIDGCPAGLELSVDGLAARPGPPPARPEQTDHPARRGRYARNLVRRLRGQDRRHVHRHPLPQRRPAQRRLRRHQGQVPPRPRRLHLRRQVRLPRLPRRRAQSAPARRSAASRPARSRRSCSRARGFASSVTSRRSASVTADDRRPDAR